MSKTDKKPCIQKRVKTWFSNLKAEDRIVLLAVLGAVLIYFVFFTFYSREIFFGFLTSFSAGFLGILIGFALDRKIEQFRDDRVKRAFLNLIFDELSEIKTKIPPQTGSVLMLYPEVWDSLISSGVVRLLSSIQVAKLSEVYRGVKGTQYEAEWVRRAVEEYNSVPASEEEKKLWLNERYLVLWDRYSKQGRKLSKEIEELLTEKWWH